MNRCLIPKRHCAPNRLIARIRGLAGRTAAELTGLSARGEGIAGVFGRAAMAAMARFHQRQVLAERTA